jgi:3',5'-cyclic AMP phosphodiesterase CpdA
MAAVVAAGVYLLACGGGSPSSPTPGDGGGVIIPPPATTVTIYAAGDIGECGFGALDTGKILDRLPGGFILALGDLAYMNGSAANFRDCYDPAWGRHIDRTRPVPGNHEYETDRTASAYYDYFGDLAGPRGLGYYAFSAGPWRIIALNSEIPHDAGSAQIAWLRNELTTSRTQCTLAYWHRPLYSSGPNFNQPDVKPYWDVLLEFGVELVLNGHDHMYEQFAPQDASGRASATGIREIIAGTGGAHLYTPGTPQPNSQVRASAYGILVLTLTSGSYSWDFASVNNTFRDTGSGACH